MDNRTRINISEKELCKIIESRVKEILKFIQEEIRRSDQENLIGAGGILIGGISLLKGVKELSEEILGLPIRIGTPHNLTGITNTVGNPAFATAVGLVKVAENHVTRLPGGKIRKGNRFSIFRKIKNWLDDIF